MFAPLPLLQGTPMVMWEDLQTSWRKGESLSFDRLVGLVWRGELDVGSSWVTAPLKVALKNYGEGNPVGSTLGYPLCVEGSYTIRTNGSDELGRDGKKKGWEAGDKI